MRLRLALREAYLAVEPVLFRALSPVVSSRHTRMGRSIAAQTYLSGSGIEIGAFASPTLVPAGCKVRYVDRVPASHWGNVPEYKGYRLVEPDILDDGATLASIPDASLDFVMSFHMLEHVPNTIDAVKSWCRVLRSGGTLIVAVPDKHFTRDARRDCTTVEHFIRDHEDGPEGGAADHYREVAERVMGLTGTAVDDYVAKAPPAIHFHVWDLESYMRFWVEVNDYLGNPLEVLEVRRNVAEDLAVLRKR